MTKNELILEALHTLCMFDREDMREEFFELFKNRSCMKRTLKEVLHAINVLERRVDIHLYGYDDHRHAQYTITPPIKVTSEGLDYFEQILDVEVMGGYLIDAGTPELTLKVSEFIETLIDEHRIGHDEWFGGDDAVLL